MVNVYIHGLFSNQKESAFRSTLRSELEGFDNRVLLISDVLLQQHDYSQEFVNKFMTFPCVVITFYPTGVSLFEAFGKDLNCVQNLAARYSIFWLGIKFGDTTPFTNSNQGCWNAETQDAASIAREINEKIQAVQERWDIDKKNRVEAQKKLEKNVADFVDPAITGLENREKVDKNIAFVCYGTGFLALLLSVVLAFTQFSGAASIPQNEWIKFTYIGVKTAFFVGLAIACSRYTFQLGNSFMNEARRSADRIHAIRFGKFFLQAYGDKADWEQLKEVFQHWNIDKDSSFISLKADDYDPKLLDKALDLAKAALEKGKKE